MPDAVPPPEDADPDGEDLVLLAVAQVLRPLIALLLAHDLKYGRLVEVLKRLMVDVARERVPGAAGERAISRVSVATGIHRKEVKRLLEVPEALAPLAGRSLAAEVFTRWLTDPRFGSPETAAPRPLPRQAQDGDGESFESLARTVSRDVHPRTVLEELLRLRMVSLEGETVSLVGRSFVPAAEQRDLLRFLADNLHDHVAAAAANVEGGPARFLEQALYADELTQASVAEAAQMAREHWQRLLAEMGPRLQAMVDADRQAGSAAAHRIRIGMFAFDAPMSSAPADTGASKREKSS